MIKPILFLVFLLTAPHLASKDGKHTHAHDWRSDEAAFKNAHVDPNTYSVLGLDQFENSITISEQDLQRKLGELTGVIPVLINGISVNLPQRGAESGRRLARSWLAQEYAALGYTVSEHSYDTGVNLIAERPGTSGKVLIVSSHFDSVNNAGANDDGSGTIAALLVAAALKDLPLTHTLRFLAFDQEERGLIGSGRYAETLNPKEVLGDIQLEMLAYNSKKDGRFHVIDCDRKDSVFLTQTIMRWVATLGFPLTRVVACTDRSDHYNFWKNNMPAIVLAENFFGGDGDRCYHKTCDVLDDRLDLTYASRIVTAVGNAIQELVQ